MALRLVKDPLNTQAESFPISSETISIGEMLDLDIGATNWTSANNTTFAWAKKIVAIEAATSSDTEVKAILINDYQQWEVDLDANSSASHNGDRMILNASGLTVNNTGTDSTAVGAVFLQRAPVGTAADATAIGWFVAGTGFDPDAS